MATVLKKLIKRFRETTYDIFGYEYGKMILRLLTEAIVVVAVLLIANVFVRIIALIAIIFTPESKSFLCTLAHCCHEINIAVAIFLISLRGIQTIWKWFLNERFHSPATPCQQSSFYRNLSPIKMFSYKCDKCDLARVVDVYKHH